MRRLFERFSRLLIICVLGLGALLALALAVGLVALLVGALGGAHH